MASFACIVSASNHGFDYMALPFLMELFSTPYFKGFKNKTMKYRNTNYRLGWRHASRRRFSSAGSCTNNACPCFVFSPADGSMLQERIFIIEERFGKCPFTKECDAVHFQFTTARRESTSRENERKFVFFFVAAGSNNSLFQINFLLYKRPASWTLWRVNFHKIAIGFSSTGRSTQETTTCWPIYCTFTPITKSCS